MSDTEDTAPPDDESLGLEGFADPDDDVGISLDELSQAYAELIDQGDDPYETPPPDEDVPTVELPAEDEEAPEPFDVSPASIIEAMLFVGTEDGSPLTSKQIAGMMRGVRPAEVDQHVEELNATYGQCNAPYSIVSEGAGYRMALREGLDSLREKFYGRVKEAKLSQAAVDVLAIVAYNQPMTSKEVEKLRGASSGAILTQLVRRELLQVERNEESPRTPHYLTSDRFLTLFGLETLNDLPQSQDVERSL